MTHPYPANKKASRPGLAVTGLLVAAVLLTTAGCDAAGDNDTAGPSVAVGAAYPNAADNRIILVNKAGTRFVYWNPVSGSFSRAQNIDQLETGQLPLNEVGAAVTFNTGGTFAGEAVSETYFFSDDGKTYSIYDRETSTFSEPAPFGREDDRFEDPKIADVGAALIYGTSPVFREGPASTRFSRTLFLINKGGTRYAEWNPLDKRWERAGSLADNIAGGGSPIASVGAAVYSSAEQIIVIFDRDGTKYALFTLTGTFSNAFDVTELGDGTLSFD